MSWIDWYATNNNQWTCKPNSPCNVTLIGALRVSLRVVSLRVVVVIRVAVGVGVAAASATREERERRTGADVGRSAQRRPLRKKKPAGTPVTPRWLSFHRES